LVRRAKAGLKDQRSLGGRGSENCRTVGRYDVGAGIDLCTVLIDEPHLSRDVEREEAMEQTVRQGHLLDTPSVIDQVANAENTGDWDVSVSVLRNWSETHTMIQVVAEAHSKSRDVPLIVMMTEVSVALVGVIIVSDPARCTVNVPVVAK
jgi:hypothetical protein